MNLTILTRMPLGGTPPLVRLERRAVLSVAEVQAAIGLWLRSVHGEGAPSLDAVQQLPDGTTVVDWTETRKAAKEKET